MHNNRKHADFNRKSSLIKEYRKIILLWTIPFMYNNYHIKTIEKISHILLESLEKD